MKQKIIIALSLLCMVACSNVGKDKYMHAGASAVIGGAAYGYTENELISYGACMGIGLAKEVYDEIDYGGFDEEDLIADAVGCTLGIYGIKGINLIKNDEEIILNFEKKF